MTMAGEQTCTISHQDRQCGLCLDTLTQSWAPRVMSVEHGKGTTALHPREWMAPQGTLDPRPACQTAKQQRQAHAKTPHVCEGWQHQIQERIWQG